MRSPSAMSHIFLENDLVLSPTSSDHDDSDSDSDGYGSDGTIEDPDSYPRWGFGVPLQRMVRASSEDDDDVSSFYRSTFSSCDSESDSSVSTSSSVVCDIDYETLVDDLLAKDPSLYHSHRLVMVEPSTPTSNDSFMIKCLPRTSPELFLILEFNHHEYREDPWNPIPQLLCAVERGEKVILCLQRLFPFDKPPFACIANYIDFFKQLLEGLSFLHEHAISQVSSHSPLSFMVDIGVGTRHPSIVDDFDRTRFPVKYYYTNLSSVMRDSESPASYVQDVKDCGLLIERMLTNLPKIGPKLKSLVQAMASGGFGAEDARKLFEALCKSIESSVFDMPVPVRDITGNVQAPSIRRSRSHPATPIILSKSTYDASTVTLVPPPMVARSQSNPIIF